MHRVPPEFMFEGVFDRPASNKPGERRTKRYHNKLLPYAKAIKGADVVEAWVDFDHEHQVWESIIELKYGEDEWPVSVKVRVPAWEYTQARPAFLRPETIKRHRLSPVRAYVTWGVPYFTEVDPPRSHPFHKLVEKVRSVLGSKAEINARYTEYRPGDA